MFGAFSVCVRKTCVALCFSLIVSSNSFADLQELTIPLDAKAAKTSGWATTDDGRIQVLVELSEPSAALAYAKAINGKSAKDTNVQRAAAAATKSSLQRIKNQQATVSAAIARTGAREIYRIARAINGIAVAVAPNQLAALRATPGVLRVLPIPLETPTLTTSVPFIGAPNLWGNTLGLPQTLTGAGIRIGIIDTGIDYLHADFGGTGLLATYQANDRTTNSDGYFPTTKVVGGTDLAGDAYTGTNTPTPDPDPMDCNGHGTHVSGIAAGFGVNSDGTTYTGAYDTTTPFSTLRIGPGVAPQAVLYAIRVFGCSGSTGLSAQGIDWALDPNNDSDFSDHLDVINMSLGSAFGDYMSATSVAAENAAAAGIIVVAAAGNSGDTYFIHGSPAASGRTISVAAIADPGVPSAVLTVNAPAAIAGNYSTAAAAFTPAGPTPSGQTASVVQALDAADASGPLTTDGCSALTNAAAIAGNIALIDRGTCGFIVKVQNAQAAGAIGVIVVGNAPGDPSLVTMGGTSPPGPDVTIPAIYISQADGTTIRAQLGGSVNATLGAATAADTIASFSSRGPRLGSGPTRLKPDIAAPGLNITSAQSGTTCASGCLTTDPSGYLPGNLTLTISGTSMATPHIAGAVALLRELHPDWSTEQIKALAMNGALHDATLGANGAPPTYGDGRTGAGRTDLPDSAVSPVVALNADDTGLVSVSFDTNEVVGTASEVKKVHLVNTGTTSATYDLSITTTVQAPGVSFSLPGGNSVTIPASGSVDLDVQLDADASQMQHTHDPTIAPTQAAPAPLTSLGNLARHWLTEASGNLVLGQSGSTKLRLPLYAAIRPASTIAAASTIVTGGAPTGSTTIPLSGTHVCTGTLGAGPTCTGSFPTDEESLVTPFELQVVSPEDATVAPAFADIQYGGVSYDPATNLILFGVSTWGDWSTPTDVAFNVYIDNNSDGVYDRILFNSNPGTADGSLFGTANVSGQDSFITFVFNLATNGVSVGTFLNQASAASVDSVVFKNNVMFLAATPASLGLAAGTTKFKYKIQTCPGFSPLCGPVSGFHYDEAVGPYVYDYAVANQGLNFGGAKLKDDLNGATLPVTWNTANMTTNGSLGALLLHHHNRSGQRAQVITLDTAPNVDLAMAQSLTPVAPNLGDNATFTLTVTNTSATSDSGVAVTDLLPVGLSYVSDDSGGSYDSSTGTWTVGSLAANSSATLHIVATVNTTDTTCNLAQITASAKIDPNPANDQASVCVMAPRASDLALSMSVSSPTAHPGDSLTYTLNVKNNGADTAYSLDVSNTFAAYPALHATSATPSQGVYDSTSGLWNIGSLAKGASASLAIVVQVPAIGGALTNTGNVTATTSDPNTANNSASATATILSPATLTATKTVSGSFQLGGTVTYTIVLSNSSPDAQLDNPTHEFVDTLPSSLSLVSSTATSGSAVSNLVTNTVSWDGSVPGNGSVTITIVATVAGGTPLGMISNQGTVNFDADGDGTNESTTMTDDPSVGGAQDPTNFVLASPSSLTATQAVAGLFHPGGTVSYTVVVSNSSSSAQLDNAGHEFTETFPAQLTAISATSTSGTATTSGNTVDWDGNVPGNGSVTITITGTIAAGTAGATISSQGTVNFDANGDGANDSTANTDDPATAAANDPTVFVVSSPSLVSATKSVTGTFTPGSTATYTIVITNNGSSTQQDNPGHEFVDNLPAQVAYAGSSTTSGVLSVSGNTVNWDGSLGAGASTTITITATVNTGTAGQTVSNIGTVNYDADGNGTNESTAQTEDATSGGATSFTVLSPSALSATKTVSGDFRSNGQIVYTVVISNHGTNAQLDNAGHEFVDTLPPQLTLGIVSSTSGTASTSGNVVMWDGSITAGGNVTITINATVNPGFDGQTVSNQGTINFDADGDGVNESSAPTDDPTKPGASDVTSFQIPGLQSVKAAPTIGDAGRALLVMLIMLLALARFRPAMKKH